MKNILLGIFACVIVYAWIKNTWLGIVVLLILAFIGSKVKN